MLQLSPQDVSAAVQPDGRDSTAVRGYMDAALAGKHPVFEWMHKNRVGREFPCEVRLARMESEERRLVRGSITDISARKRAEKLATGEKSVLEMIAGSAPLSEILGVITSTVEQVATEASCAMLLLDQAGRYLSVGSAPSLPAPLVEAIDKVEIECGEAAQAKWWRAIQSEYAENLPVLPLYFRANAFIMPKWLSGVTPTGHQYPSTLWIENWTAQ